MKSPIIFFLFVVMSVILGGLYFIKGERSYADVLLLTTRGMDKVDAKDGVKKTDKPQELVFISANIPDPANTLSNKHRQQKTDNKAIHKCVDDNNKIIFTQFDCPQGSQLAPKQ